MENQALDTSASGSDVNMGAGTANQSSTTPQSEPGTQQAAPEKTFSQKELGSIINRATREAEQKAYEKAKREFESRQQAMSQQTSQPSNQTQPQLGLTQEAINDLLASKVDATVNERLQQAQLQAQAEQIANQFNTKMATGKERYSDFDETVSALNFETMMPVVHWANQLDNTADIMYDLAKNPAKLSNVINLANSGQAQLAYRELARLSDSIKTNEAAKKTPNPNAPLSQLKPSPIGADNGDSDVSALRKQPWLRG